MATTTDNPLLDISLLLSQEFTPLEVWLWILLLCTCQLHMEQLISQQSVPSSTLTQINTCLTSTLPMSPLLKIQ